MSSQTVVIPDSTPAHNLIPAGPPPGNDVITAEAIVSIAPAALAEKEVKQRSKCGHGRSRALCKECGMAIFKFH